MKVTRWISATQPILLQRRSLKATDVAVVAAYQTVDSLVFEPKCQCLCEQFV
eukprot:m.91409 g.91409  ORF g.91409 m.91409 type:complete len:52 (+) comp12947_c1_seq1:211-366(+)